MRLTLCTPITAYKGLDFPVNNVVPFWCMGAVLAECPSFREPRAGSRVVRIDSLCFLAGCRKRRLNRVLSVLYLSMFFIVLLFIRAYFIYC